MQVSTLASGVQKEFVRYVEMIIQSSAIPMRTTIRTPKGRSTMAIKIAYVGKLLADTNSNMFQFAILGLPKHLPYISVVLCLACATIA